MLTKFDLTFAPPLMNAAGSLGFLPNPDSPVELSSLGAFITNPISLRPRSPARISQLLDFPGGFLMHSGYPNPGLRSVLWHYSASWARMPIPIIVHILGEDSDRVSEMVTRLEGTAGVMGIEIGLPPKAGPDTALALARAAARELPVIMRLPLDRAAALAYALTSLLGKPFLAALSLGPPRGVLPGLDKGHIQGRMYGPAVFPLALAAVHAVAETGWPIIGGGGVYTTLQVKAMLAAGAMAVQLDAVLWRGGNITFE